MKTEQNIYRIIMGFWCLLVFSLLVGATPLKDSPRVKLGGVSIQVEVARTREDWQKGLMFREKMAPHEGMLFWGEFERPQSFWMKNTLIPLDIIYISKDKRIVSIIKNAEPLSEVPRPSEGPALHVLEVIGGTSDKFKWKKGDRVEFFHINHIK